MLSFLIRRLALTALAVPALIIAVNVTGAQATVTGQCDTTHTCVNFWNGGFAVSSYQGYSGNNAISVQWLPGGSFQLRDNLHGGCIGDYLGSPSSPRAGGGNTCNSTSTGLGGAPGTRFQVVNDGECPAGYTSYWNPHNLGYVTFADGNGHPVYLNRGGNCLHTTAA